MNLWHKKTGKAVVALMSVGSLVAMTAPAFAQSTTGVPILTVNVNGVAQQVPLPAGFSENTQYNASINIEYQGVSIPIPAMSFYINSSGTGVVGTISTGTLQLMPASKSVAPGSQVDLTANIVSGTTTTALTDSQVTYMVTPEYNSSGDVVATVASNSAGTQEDFAATTPGTYTVTATYNGQTASSTISVYGQAAAVNLSAASSTLVADGTATDVITATVVDSNKNTVNNYNGNVNVYMTGPDGLTNGTITTATGTLAAPLTYTAKDGVVQLTLNSKTTAVRTTPDVIYAQVPGSSTWQSTSISEVAAQATGVGFAAVTPLDSGIDNETTLPAAPDKLKVMVLDQAGQAVVSSSTYDGTATLSGPAVFENGTQSMTFSLASGTSTASLPIEAATANSAGTITVSVSVPGLTNPTATTTVTAYAQGVASQLGLVSQPTTTSFSADTLGSDGTSPFLTYQVQAEDAAGNATTDDAPSAIVPVVDFNGAVSSEVVAKPTTTSAGVYSVALALTGTATAGTTNIPAGTYTVTMPATTGTDSNSVAGLKETFTVTPGAISTVAVTPSATTVESTTNPPATTVSAQLMDAWGNPLLQSGVIVDFESSSPPNLVVSPSPSPDGITQVQTNAEGIATVSATPTDSTGGMVEASVADSAPVDSGMIEEASSTASQVKVTSTEPTYTAGTEPSFTAYAETSAGAPVSGTLHYAVTGPNNYTASGTATNGSAVTLHKATTAGTYTATVTNTTAVGEPSGTVTFTVAPAAYSTVDFMANGVNETTGGTGVSGITVAANTPVAVTVEAVDAYGNPVAAPEAITISGLAASESDGVFEDAAGNIVTSVTIPAGQTSATVDYVNATAGTSVTFSGTPTVAETLPTLQTATLNTASTASYPNEVVLAYNGALMPTSSMPVDASQFAVMVNGSADAVTGVTVSNVGSGITTGYVILSLAAVPTAGQTVTVSYTPNSTYPVMDTSGDNVAAISNEDVQLQ